MTRRRLRRVRPWQMGAGIVGVAYLALIALHVRQWSPIVVIALVIAPAAILTAVVQRLQHRTAPLESWGTPLVVGAAVGYVTVTAWLMAHATFDIWGGFAALPIVGAVAVPLTRFLLRDQPRAVVRAAMVGLVVKLAGTAARYGVSYGAYHGRTDAIDYHNAGKQLAGDLYHARVSFLAIIPHTAGKSFIGQLAGLIYSFTGSSQLSGFFWFALLGFIGVVLNVKAVCIALPDAALTRYAWLCFVMPSLVYWPSSIGKEAWMGFTLGFISMGAAQVYRGAGLARALPWLVAGGVGSAMVRPHMTVIWIGGAAVALVWALIAGRIGEVGRKRGFGTGLVAVVAIIGLFFVARFTATYLQATNEAPTSISSSVTSIFDKAAHATSEAGSAFKPVTINSPLDYPEAILRTLTRPWITEINSFASLLPGLEMLFFAGLLLYDWRHLVHLPSLLSRRPYVLYCVLVALMFGLAFSTFSNLAILTRQRSLVMPHLLLLACLPGRRQRRRRRQPAWATSQPAPQLAGRAAP